MTEVKVYNLVWRTDEAGDREWYECPVCGTLTTAEAREHGPTHVLPASTPWAPPARIIADARTAAEEGGRLMDEADAEQEARDLEFDLGDDA